MWIFSTIGFFSVTQVKEKPEQLQIRARVRGDLDLLRTKYLPTLSETVELAHRDYPYRAYTDRVTLGQAMVQMMLDLNYSNFKNEVMDKQGLAREQLYAEVWTVMYGAERKLEEKERRNASRPAHYHSFDEFWEKYRDDAPAVIPVSPKASQPMSFDDADLGVPSFVPKRERRSTERTPSRNVVRRPSKPTKPTSKRR